MSDWPSTKARKVLKALRDLGWVEKSTRKKKRKGSHLQLKRRGWPDYTWAFKAGEELGPAMLKRIARHTGLTPEDL